MRSENQEVKKQVIRYFIYLFIVLGLTVLAFYLSIGNKSVEIYDTLTKANLWILAVVFAIVIACILLRSTVNFLLFHTYEKDYYFHRAIAFDQIGTLYSLVTPAGIGKQVMQIYIGRKQQLPLSSILSVIAMYSIVYQIVLILYGLITIICKANLINNIGHISFSFSNDYNLNVPLWLLVGIGFALNVGTIGFVFLISYWNGFYRFIEGPICKLLAKVRLIKDLDKTRANLVVSRDNFRRNLEHLFKNIPVLIASIICFFLYITLSYSTPYFIGLSLGNTSPNANFWDSVLLSNFHQMITCIIPIPGSAFSSELFFLNLFYPGSDAVNFYSSEDIARASLLLWRTLMFIFPLVISALYTIIYRPRKRKPTDVSSQENPGQQVESHD